jgi:hypothetical protein
MRPGRILAAVAAGSFALAGCSAAPSPVPSPTLVSTRIEAFASPGSAAEAGETVLVVPATTRELPTLEELSWVRLAEAELVARGFRAASSPAEASLVAVIGLAIDAGRDVLMPLVVPQVGITGVYNFGTYGPYFAQGIQVPRYGITGFTTGVTSERMFTRHGVLRVFRPSSEATAAPVFEARATSEGSCRLLSAVAPNLISALFHYFPEGGSGQVATELKHGC